MEQGPHSELLSRPMSSQRGCSQVAPVTVEPPVTTLLMPGIACTPHLDPSTQMMVISVPGTAGVVHQDAGRVGIPPWYARCHRCLFPGMPGAVGTSPWDARCNGRLSSGHQGNGCLCPQCQAQWVPLPQDARCQLVPLPRMPVQEMSPSWAPHASGNSAHHQ